jgi:hypothetical protein
VKPDLVLVALAAAALAVATETRTGAGDGAVIAGILEPLPDGLEREFVALLRGYQQQHDRYGAGALQRSGLALARCACGLDP